MEDGRRGGNFPPSPEDVSDEAFVFNPSTIAAAADAGTVAPPMTSSSFALSDPPCVVGSSSIPLSALGLAARRLSPPSTVD